MDIHRRLGLMAKISLVVLASAPPADAGPWVLVEAVGDFSSQPGWPSLGTGLNGAGCASPQPGTCVPIDDATAFLSGVTASPPNTYHFRPYLGSSSPPGAYFNNTVWTSDFMDPQATALADQDHVYFDARGNAISYYSGHGFGTIGQTHGRVGPPSLEQPCTHNSQCTSPPYSGISTPGFCQRLPGDGPDPLGHRGSPYPLPKDGFCAYTDNGGRAMKINSTSGPASVARNGKINLSSGQVRWGESVFSQWGGVGAAGGTNVVVLNGSGLEGSHREYELFPVFAGVHMLLTEMVHSGDTLLESDRGYYFALSYQQTPSSPVASNWVLLGQSLAPVTPGAACGDYHATFPPGGGNIYGGGMGVSGCGGQSFLALGATVAEAVNHVHETWRDIMFDRSDATGNGFYDSYVQCNYDCNYWTFDLP